MTTLAIFKILVLCALIVLASYSIYREADLIKFERKVGKYVKAFFKALYYTIRNKKIKNNVTKMPNYHNAEYDEMLARLNKASKIENIKVA